MSCVTDMRDSTARASRADLIVRSAGEDNLVGESDCMQRRQGEALGQGAIFETLSP